MGGCRGRRRGGDPRRAAAEPRRGSGAKARGPPMTPASRDRASGVVGNRRPWSSHAEASRWHRLGGYLRAFWDRAYEENITGLAGMVAYNLLLSVFPFALLVLFVFGQSCRAPTSRRACCATCSGFPGGRPNTLERPRPHPRELDHDRHRGRARRASGSGPRSGARWTPPSAASTTSSAAAGSPEALRPGDAGRRAAVHRRDRRVPTLREHPRLRRRRPPVRALRRSTASRSACRSSPA